MTCEGCSFAGQSTATEHTYVGVRFGEETNLTLCATEGRLLVKGARVVVAGEQGPAVGVIEKSPMPVFKPCQKSSASKILREASARDLERDDRRRTSEVRASRFTRERARAFNLPMKIAKVQFNLDHNHAYVYFTAPGRVDFRRLVRDFSRRFKVRVRMVQVGSRDEAKLLGGLGVCGRTLCCSSWIGEFRSISVQMAKRQGLSLNPTKISGQCGRLLCCLKYEDDQYRRSAPKPESVQQSGREPKHAKRRNHRPAAAESRSRNPVKWRPGSKRAAAARSSAAAKPGRRLHVM